MDIRDQIDYYLNTAFKRVNVGTPSAGHNLIQFAEWNRTDGFVKKDIAEYGEVVVPCPVIAIVDTKIRESNLTLTITGKVAQQTGTETFNQIGREITKDVYGESETTIETTFEVPRFTRTGATFLLSGLENKIYEITDITSNVDVFGQRGGKIKFYGLASDGSKVLWLLGMYKIHNTIKEIINGIWVVPSVCPYCNATGIDPDTGDTCPQCQSYGYSGYNAEKGIQIDKGYDVRLTREKYSEYPVTDAQNMKIWEFVNKVWTQKWHVTPTVKNIKALFAHFYNLREEDIIITERYHFSMPHWQVNLPLETALGSPFDAGETDLANFIAESVTPAGVNVFVGFYETRFIGNLDDMFEQDFFFMKSKPKILSKRMWEIGSLSEVYDDWGSRFRCYNGWNDALDSFEVTGVALSGVWATSGTANIYNANDRLRHVARLIGNGSSMVYDLESPYSSGHTEFWIHPESSDLRCSLLSAGDGELYYVEYNQLETGFKDGSSMFHNMYPDNEAHVRIYWNDGQSETKVFINREEVDVGSSPIGDVSKVKFHNTSDGTGFIDAFGATPVGGYLVNQNWQTLYPWGWGLNHLDFLGGVSGLLQNYFLPDMPFNIN